MRGRPAQPGAWMHGRAECFLQQSEVQNKVLSELHIRRYSFFKVSADSPKQAKFCMATTGSESDKE